MRIVVVPDAAALAREAADRIARAVRAVPDARLGLPTGTTPIATYAELERLAAAGALNMSRVTVYALDEFAGVTRTTPGTNSVFFRQRLRVGLRALHVPNPAARDADEHMAAFADAIRRSGGLGLCLLGVGANGHIAFNEPGSGRDSRARAVELTDASRSAHADAFGGMDRVPRLGMTLGVADILDARAILTLASGKGKAAIVAAAIDGPMTAGVPASWLQAHGDVTWLLDDGAASRLAGEIPSAAP